jgi:hypothetical protein
VKSSTTDKKEFAYSRQGYAKSKVVIFEKNTDMVLGCK